MRPDIEAFKAGLVIGGVPRKYPIPILYNDLKPEHKKRLKEAYDAFPMPEDTFTDHETGKTYISENMFVNTPEQVLEDFLAYQVGCFSYMKGQIIEGKSFDEEEAQTANLYMQEFCERIPNQKDIYIVRRGFERRLFFNDGTDRGKYIADLPPKGGANNEDEISLLNHIYPQAFSIITRAVMNRNGNIEALGKNIEEGKFYPTDFAYDSPNFSLRFYILSHFMANNPWPIFDSLLNGNTAETNRLLHDGLEKDVQGNIFQFLIDGLVADERLIQKFKMTKDIEAFIEEQVKLYWKTKLN